MSARREDAGTWTVPRAVLYYFLARDPIQIILAGTNFPKVVSRRCLPSLSMPNRKVIRSGLTLHLAMLQVFIAGG